MISEHSFPPTFTHAQVHYKLPPMLKLDEHAHMGIIVTQWILPEFHKPLIDAALVVRVIQS